MSSKTRPLPPVDKWNPDFCGDINLTIALDGRWFYEGSPIGRASLVQLFASVLKREDDKYFLVTPVEKVGITVEDTPFIVTQWRKEKDDTASGDTYIFTTQTDDIVRLEHSDQLELRVPPQSNPRSSGHRHSLSTRSHKPVGEAASKRLLSTT